MSVTNSAEQRYVKAVVQIQCGGKRSIGSLIGGNLVITHCQVIANRDEALGGQALFCNVTNGQGAKFRVEGFKFNPADYFYTSRRCETDVDPSGFTIVALENTLSLSQIQNVCLSLFDNPLLTIPQSALAVVANLKQHGNLELLKQHIQDSIAALAKLESPDQPTRQDRWVDIPPPLQFFTGRANELADLHTKCSNNQRVAITGPSGIGKTALVLKYVKLHRSGYNTVHVVEGFDAKSIKNGLLKFADDHNIAGANLEEKLINLQERLKKETNCLFVFDGVDTEDGLQFLESYLPNQAGLVIVTTQMPARGKSFLEYASIPIEKFNREEACEYIKKATSQTEKADALAIALDYSPLLLTHACSYIAAKKTSIDTFLKHFHEKQPTNPTQEQAILTILNLSLCSISPTAVKLFHCCTYFGSADIPKDLLELWVDKYAPNEEVSTCIKELLDYSLIKSRKPNCYNIHGLVKQVISTEIGLNECIEIVNAYMEKFNYHEKDSWCHAQQIAPHVTHLLDMNPQQISLKVTYVLLSWLGDYYQYLQKDFDLALGYYNKSLEVMYKENSRENVEWVMVVANKIGNVLQAQGKSEESLIYHKNVLTRQGKAYGTENHTQVASTLYYIGNALWLQRKYEEALKSYQQSLVIQTKIDNEHISVAETLYAIGNVLRALGKQEEALEYYQKALELKIKIYDCKEHTSLAKTMHAIGDMLKEQGKYGEALDWYEKALVIEREVYGSEKSIEVAETLYKIGGVLQTQKKYKKSLDYFEKTLAIEKRAYGGEEHTEIAVTLNQIGNTLLAQGKEKKALDYHKKALAIQTEFYRDKSHISMALTLYAIGNALSTQGNLESSLECYRKTLEIEREAFGCEDHISMAVTLATMSSVLRAQDKWAEALVCYRKAEAIDPKIGDHTPFGFS